MWRKKNKPQETNGRVEEVLVFFYICHFSAFSFLSSEGLQAYSFFLFYLETQKKVIPLKIKRKTEIK